MKIKEYLINDYLQEPREDINLFFFIGPDTGLTDQRISVLSKSLNINFKNPFCFSRIEQNDLEKNPSKLLDESLTYSFGSDKKFVFLKIYTDNLSLNISKSIKELVARFPVKNTKIIISARNLSLTSPLVKYINENIFCNTFISYQKNYNSIKNEIISIFSTKDINISNDALELLVSNLGDDQMNTNSIIENIMSFIFPKKSIEYEDIIATTPNSISIEIDKVVFSVFTGNKIETVKNIEILNASGVSSIEILRTFLRWTIDLKIACNIYKNSSSIDKAVSGSAAFVFWKNKPKFEQSIKLCINLDFDNIIDRLLVLEQKVKYLPNLETSLLTYSLLKLSKMVA